MKKSTKHTKRRLTVFGTISLIVIILFIYNLISYISLINKLEKEKESLQNRLKEINETISQTEEEIEKLKNPEYLAKYARENFLYSKDGEYIIRIDKNNKLVLEMDTTSVDNRQKIVIVLLILTLSILIVYICFKIRKRSLE